VVYAVDGPIPENDRFFRVWAGPTDKGPVRVLLSVIDYKDPQHKDVRRVSAIFEDSAGMDIGWLQSTIGFSDGQGAAPRSAKGSDRSGEEGRKSWTGSAPGLVFEIDRFVDVNDHPEWRVTCNNDG
jgi:hypothetical protein